MPFLLAEILNFQGSEHLIGVGSLSSRIIEMCLPLKVIGVDRRKIQSKEKMKKAQNLIDEQ